jgi:hypothetical protein
MRTEVNFSARSLHGLARALLSLLTLTMLVSFPLTKDHDFNSHFRNAEIRRSVTRHTFISQPEDHTLRQAVRPDIRPISQILIEIRDDKPGVKFIVVPCRPVRRLLLRLKSGPPGAGGQDPLI